MRDGFDTQLRKHLLACTTVNDVIRVVKDAIIRLDGGQLAAFDLAINPGGPSEPFITGRPRYENQSEPPA